VGNDIHFVFRQELLDEDGSVRRGVVMVNQPALISPNVEAMTSDVYRSVAAKRRSRSRISQFGFGTGASRYHNCYIDGTTTSNMRLLRNCRFGMSFLLCCAVVLCGRHLVRHVVASWLFRWECISIIRNVGHGTVGCVLIVL
jgi:hypothetical protein